MYAHKEKVCWFKRHMKIKKIRTFSVGNFVSVKSPRIDSMSTDLHRGCMHSCGSIWNGISPLSTQVCVICDMI